MTVAFPDSEIPDREEVSEERELVARAQARDPLAFRELVERHRRHAYAVALRVLGSEADAEDAAQEAFVRAWLALPTFRREARFSTWLHAIVLRRALDRAAQRRMRQTRETELEAVEALPDVRETLPDQSRLARRLHRVMDGLTPIQRTVVTAFYYEDRSVVEIAGMLRIPEGTVKTHLSRARRSMREAWMREDSRSS